MTEKLFIETDPRGVTTLTLNRPDKGNPFDAELLTALSGALRDASANAGVRVVVLRGAGKHFCTGADTGAMGGGAAPATSGERITIATVCRDVAVCRKPVLAVVQGACIGGGLAVAAACDLVVAREDAFFSLPEVRLGFAPGPLIPFLLRGMGPRATRRYLLTAERFDAAQARAMELAHEVCSEADLEPTVARMINVLLLGAPGAQPAIKDLLDRPGIMDIGCEALAALQAGVDAAAATDETKEGIASMREKRPPSWYRK